MASPGRKIYFNGDNNDRPINIAARSWSAWHGGGYHYLYDRKNL